MTDRTSVTLSSLGAAALIGLGVLLGPSDGAAQTRTEEGDRIIISPTESRAAAERDQIAADEMRGADPDDGRRFGGDTPRTDRLVAQARAEERERMQHEMRERRNREGEVYIAGYGGVTLGNLSTVTGVEGRGTAAGQPFADPNLEYGATYGLKIGYFHPGRLNWLGLEIEGYNSNPHIRQSGLQPGSRMRLSMLGLNAIARTKLACDDRRRDRDDADYSPLRENSICPLQAYVGAGLGVFFAETNNQFGRSTENARAGLNALAGAKYFFNEHLALFAEYKFNYVDLKFDQFAGPTSGLNGTFMVHHVVGGLAVHF